MAAGGKKATKNPTSRIARPVTSKEIASDADAWVGQPVYGALLSAGFYPDNAIYDIFYWLAPGTRMSGLWKMQAIVPPLSTKTINLHCPSNRISTTVSADAAGITAALFAFS
jgi:hypothetical protein